MTGFAPNESPLLYGAGDRQRIVAVEADPQGELEVYRRDGDKVSRTVERWRPWLVTAAFDSKLPENSEVTVLKGAGARNLLEFSSLTQWSDAKAVLRNKNTPFISVNSPVRMALMRSGDTLFKGMQFSEIVRMQFDLESTGLDASLPDARILLIAVADTKGLLEIIEGDEEHVISSFIEMVNERNPDVLEGHNVFGFDLPYLIGRAKRLGIPLTLGRNSTEPRVERQRNYAIGGFTRPFTPVTIHGRHVLDTYLIVQRFDWARGALSRYGLKECARVFGFADEDRVELPRDRMEELLTNQHDTVLKYARQDVVETQKLANLVTPVEFYQTQMTPDNYQAVAASGAGDKINSLLIRAYLRTGTALPIGTTQEANLGGYTQLVETGVINHVVKADVESLYPSLMLAENIAPASDTENVFLPCLKELTKRRIEAKQRAAKVKEHGGSDYEYWDGLQASFKVLINSFYGYLGGPFPFNDPAAAGRVTELGRSLVQSIANKMTKRGCRVIEIDTDGVYFVPPDGASTEEAERAFVASIDDEMPPGIRLAFDGRYRKMISLKTKNYVLQTYDGKQILRGAALRSRSDEPFGRQFLEEAITLILNDASSSVPGLYHRWINRLIQRDVNIELLARRERVTTKTFSSEHRKRSAAVATGVVVGEFVDVYERDLGDLARIEDYNDDENTAYYVAKLHKFAMRLSPAFGGEAECVRLFPLVKFRPGQGELGLF